MKMVPHPGVGVFSQEVDIFGFDSFSLEWELLLEARTGQLGLQRRKRRNTAIAEGLVHNTKLRLDELQDEGPYSQHFLGIRSRSMRQHFLCTFYWSIKNQWPQKKC
ncbi:unnamed protein product [Nesidiocoris tenuis]|uniref:Uncharacterized protein n=1 Tax=Nesidiocoris tenuis TaxID=355587 RepID=A0A6H5HVQ1_9HEMI|nr:unnamed protein product [Nesidiocoris tenuis]